MIEHELNDRRKLAEFKELASAFPAGAAATAAWKLRPSQPHPCGRGKCSASNSPAFCTPWTMPAVNSVLRKYRTWRRPVAAKKSSPHLAWTTRRDDRKFARPWRHKIRTPFRSGIGSGPAVKTPPAPPSRHHPRVWTDADMDFARGLVFGIADRRDNAVMLQMPGKGSHKLPAPPAPPPPKLPPPPEKHRHRRWKNHRRQSTVRWPCPHPCKASCWQTRRGRGGTCDDHDDDKNNDWREAPAILMAMLVGHGCAVALYSPLVACRIAVTPAVSPPSKSPALKRGAISSSMIRLHSRIGPAHLPSRSRSAKTSCGPARRRTAPPRFFCPLSRLPRLRHAHGIVFNGRVRLHLRKNRHENLVRGLALVILQHRVQLRGRAGGDDVSVVVEICRGAGA